MERNTQLRLARDLMADFAERTGLSDTGKLQQRYLWTDAFAVCNFLELERRTGERHYRDVGLGLVDQVHRVLGRHRDDNSRSGWISGLSEEEGRRHPTAGGLRIGKPLAERGPREPFDEVSEWDRDGQYYHYLTKWMHALYRVSRATGEPEPLRWARELAKTAHARFTYALPNGRRGMHWKMSIDLTRPLVPSMGHHDPLDGLVTALQLRVLAVERAGGPDLEEEIIELEELCKGRDWSTTDPLGLGGLLFDACRVAQLTTVPGFEQPGLLEGILAAALRGLRAWEGQRPLESPSRHRLAFRELGLSIGLKGLLEIRRRTKEHPTAFSRRIHALMDATAGYSPHGEQIGVFWSSDANRSGETWVAHRNINQVMLATALIPEGVLIL